MRRGLITADQLAEVRAARPDAPRLDLAAAEMGFVAEDVALQAVGDEVGLRFVDLNHEQVDLELLESFPQRMIHRHALFPIQRQNGSLLVATS